MLRQSLDCECRSDRIDDLRTLQNFHPLKVTAKLIPPKLSINNAVLIAWPVCSRRSEYSQ